MLQSDKEQLKCNRPIASAAAAVEAAAYKAREMMEQVQTSWWWPLITAKVRSESDDVRHNDSC